MHVGGARQRRTRGRLGQVVVEMLLILPVFMTIVFTIMELGHMAFWVIVLNHATYECARIGGLTAGPKPGGSGIKNVNLNDIMHRIIREANVEAHRVATSYDRQAELQNYDLLVTGSYKVRLVFPISNIMLANPRGSASRLITATVRMPIEQPLGK